MSIHARTLEGEEPRAVFRDNTIRVDLEDGAIEGTVWDSGGFIDHEEEQESLFYEGGFEECLVWSALGHVCTKAHDYAIVVTTVAPQPHWLGRVGQVSRIDEDRVHPFAPMTVAGWLSRVDANGEPEFLVVLASREL